MNQMNPAFVMPDVQSTVDTRQIPIQRVGVKAVRHPLTVRTQDGAAQPTIGIWNLDVHLPAEQKGTHMSRFVALLEERTEPLDVATLRTMLAVMLEKLEARAGRIEVSFPYFVNKTAPVSGVQSLLDYEVTLAGEGAGAGHEPVSVLEEDLAIRCAQPALTCDDQRGTGRRCCG
jgi:GTP cyclohydrolase I